MRAFGALNAFKSWAQIIFRNFTLADQASGTLTHSVTVCMTADNGHEIISGSARPKKHSITLVLNILKEVTLPHPSTTVVGISAIHLIFTPFPAAVLAAPGGVLT